MSATYVGAVAVEAVRCPPWCEVSQERHLQELHELEGFVIHHSPVVDVGDGCTLAHAASTYSDGRPDRSDPPTVFIDERPVSLATAEALAHALLAAVQEARG